ncbi:hypothetical protein L218DRAFT_957142 [Marasmius fiardii PR-910]|nr:hypothetical protein L218DRAFT_957142 [Marasmius fiardii PR-910]
MIILQKKRTQHHYLYTATITILFVLATFGVFVNTFVATRGVFGLIDGQVTGVPPSEREFPRIVTFSFIAHLAYIISNTVADALLLLRCYHVWNSRLVIVFPTVLCIVCNVLGFVSTSVSFVKVVHSSARFDLKTLVAMDDRIVGRQPLLLAFLTLDLVSNLLLTFLIATRLFFIMRQLARRTEAKGLRTMYTSVMVVVVESGILYPVGLIALLSIANNAITYSLIHFVGIAPTLIIVRIGLGTALQLERGCVETRS